MKRAIQDKMAVFMVDIGICILDSGLPTQILNQTKKKKKKNLTSVIVGTSGSENSSRLYFILMACLLHQLSCDCVENKSFLFSFQAFDLIHISVGLIYL